MLNPNEGEHGRSIPELLRTWFAVLVYGIIAIHDIPARISHARHHPHEDAIHAAGWISLFMLHLL
jgi:hypothetical protein